MNGHNRRHQADKLMELFQEVANHQPDDKEPMEDEEMKRDEYVELDVLNLPPRREVHGNKKGKYSFSLARPSVRLFVVIVFVIAILCLVYSFNREALLTFFY